MSNLEVGMRVRLSDKFIYRQFNNGAKRQAQYQQKRGTILRRYEMTINSRGGSWINVCWCVLWDGLVSPYSYHESFLMADDQPSQF